MTCEQGCDLGDFIPGWEDPHRYSHVVDFLACDILGHRPRHCTDTFRGRGYAWSYCLRCGRLLSGVACPLIYTDFYGPPSPLANVRLTDILDPDLVDL